MRQDLAADQRMAGVEVVSLQLENLLKMTDHRLANPGHRSTALTARLHRGLVQRRLINARFINNAEQVETRPHVETETMVRDPAVDGHADRGHARPAEEDSGMAGLHRPAEHELVKNAQERLFQTREIARKGELGRTQGHGQIRCELAGEMKHATTTPINPMHANSQRRSVSSSGII